MRLADRHRSGRHRQTRLSAALRRTAFRGGIALAATLLVVSGLWAVSPPAAQAEIVPVAYDDSYAGDRDTPFSIDEPGALGNDFGAGPGYRARLVSDDSIWPGATLDFHADGSFEYDPNSPDLAGENSFTYCISTTESSTCVSNEATVYLFVDEPFVIPHSYGMAADGVLSVNAPGLLIGSRNPKPDDVLYQLSSPQHGIVEFHSDGAFTYTPAPGFTGTDSFGYCLSNDDDWPACSGNTARDDLGLPDAAGSVRRHGRGHTVRRPAVPAHRRQRHLQRPGDGCTGPWRDLRRQRRCLQLLAGRRLCRSRRLRLLSDQ